MRSDTTSLKRGVNTGTETSESAGAHEQMRPLNYQVMFDVEDDHWWFVGRRAIVFAQIEDALEEPARRDGREILDIGCGTGATLARLEQFGDVQGIDVSPMALGYCRKRGQQRVLCASATDLPFASGTFDLVTALDVIEHLDDDHRGVAEIARVLKPGAPAIIFVPAFKSLWGPNDDQSGHKRRYRLRELQRVVEEAGLRIERLSYANVVMFLPIWLGRRLLTLFGRTGQTENEINHPMINRMLTRAFAAEAGPLRRHSFPFGVSLICTARKPLVEN
ncbi:MAG: methyltransferase domain-containing protein [Acidobacteriota bacterium]